MTQAAEQLVALELLEFLSQRKQKA